MWGAAPPLTPPTPQVSSPRGMWCCALLSSPWRPWRRGWARSSSMLRTPRDTLRRYRSPDPPSGRSPQSPFLGDPPVPRLCVTPFPRFWGLFPPQAKVVPNNDKKRTYSVTYVPKVGGLHKVSPLLTPQGNPSVTPPCCPPCSTPPSNPTTLPVMSPVTPPPWDTHPGDTHLGDTLGHPHVSEWWLPLPCLPPRGMGDTWHSGVWGSLGGSPCGMALGGPGVLCGVPGVPH